MRALERCFDQYGRFVARQPLFFILIPTIITIFSSYGFVFFHSQDDIWDIYAPLNGLSRVEEKALEPFEYASGSHHHRMQVLVRQSDGGNLLNTRTLSAISRAHSFVAENITASDGRSTFVYRQLCGVYCNDSNAAIVALFEAAIAKNSQNAVQLTFPNAEALQKRVFLGYSLGDISFNNRTKEVAEARLLILHYMVDKNLPNGKELAESFESQLREFFTTLNLRSNLRFAFLSRTRELEEQRAITITSLPFLGLTIFVLTAFMLITLVRLPFYKSQHYESLVGVISPGMALWTTTGFLWWLGYPFSNILTVVPFLVITIGIDDAFLILAGWRQSTKGKSLEERMGEAVAISGASVTVTSVTDVVCFATGLFSNLPVVQLFCLYTTIALAVDFFYQMTFFTAFVGIIVRKQVSIEMDETKMSSPPSPSSSNSDFSSSNTLSSLVSFVPSLSTSSSARSRTSLEVFVDFLHMGIVKVTVVVLFTVHIAVCCYLTTEVSTEFDMENLYLVDSPLTDISRRMQKFVLGEAFVVNFAVQPMPNFENETIRAQFEEMVSRLESIRDFGGGVKSTNLWIRDYANAVAFWGDEENFWAPADLVANVREYGIEEKFINVRHNKSNKEYIQGFFFTITYRNMKSFQQVEQLLLMRRNIISEYPFHVLSHHPLEKVPTESAASAPSNFVQTSVSAVILMSLLVLLFVMHLEAIVSVVVSIVSICLGIVAYLHVWDVHLDAVSLISMLMSIGFSVDYSAHVCYHYFAHGHAQDKSAMGKYGETRRRLLSTLKGVGWPVMQSGLSTILGMFPLMFVRAYVVAVFWKTVILVGVLGMLHALILLPIIFILTQDLRHFCRSKS